MNEVMSVGIEGIEGAISLLEDPQIPSYPNPPTSEGKGCRPGDTLGCISGGEVVG